LRRHLCFGPAHHDRLRHAAQAAGVSESELAREAIDDYLAKGA
jgi:pyrroloquinoline quinone (PQQ) biosynthesis protein C